MCYMYVKLLIVLFIYILILYMDMHAVRQYIHHIGSQDKSTPVVCQGCVCYAGSGVPCI